MLFVSTPMLPSGEDGLGCNDDGMAGVIELGIGAALVDTV